MLLNSKIPRKRGRPLRFDRDIMETPRWPRQAQDRRGKLHDLHCCVQQETGEAMIDIHRARACPTSGAQASS